MGRPLEEIVEFPKCYFTYSLKSRNKLRYQRSAWFLNCSHQRFEEQLQVRYIEAESFGPSFVIGGKLELLGHDHVVSSEPEENESDDEILYSLTMSL